MNSSYECHFSKLDPFHPSLFRVSERSSNANNSNWGTEKARFLAAKHHIIDVLYLKEFALSLSFINGVVKVNLD